jgi:integral membrane protein (TIGR01906 family)
MKVFKAIAHWLIICCLPLLLIASTIRWGVNDLRLYEYGVNTYDISNATGIDRSELIKVYQQLIDFYNSRVASPQVEVDRNGETFNIFSEKELIHLNDVKGLMMLDYVVQWITIVVIIVSALVIVLIEKEKWRELAKSMFRGSIATIVLMVFLGLWSFIGFENLFILFHLISFSNELWILDPSRDYLIMLFPGGFFYDVALYGFAAIIMESIIIGGIAFAIVRRQDVRFKRI